MHIGHRVEAHTVASRTTKPDQPVAFHDLEGSSASFTDRRNLAVARSLHYEIAIPPSHLADSLLGHLEAEKSGLAHGPLPHASRGGRVTLGSAARPTDHLASLVT